MRWVFILLLAGCQVTAQQAEREAVDTAALEDEIETGLAPEAVDARVRGGALDVARLRSSDADIYQPAFRILDDNGRLRLIVQDPITHRYKLVR